MVLLIELPLLDEQFLDFLIVVLENVFSARGRGALELEVSVVWQIAFRFAKLQTVLI